MSLKFFCKTFYRDVEWYGYMVRSIRKFAQGSELITVVDSGVHVEADRLYTVEAFAPEALNIPDGYLRQQYIKLVAHRLLDEDTVFIDSDTVLKAPVSEDTWVIDGRPIWHFTPYDAMGRGGPPWRLPTSKIVGFSVENEFMRHMGLWMRPHLLEGLGNYLEKLHGKPLWQIVSTMPIFSEFNVYGAWCFRFMPEAYMWLHTEIDGIERVPPVRQFWSRMKGGVGAAKIELEALLR